MADAVTICNDALTYLGTKRIAALDENSPAARACAQVYEQARDAMLQDGRWVFAIKRVTLAPDADAPAHGYTYAYTLPADYVRLEPPDEGLEWLHMDWVIEGDKLLTDYGTELDLIYLYRLEDANKMRPAFRDALAAEVAVRIHEAIKPSNVKKASAEARAERMLRRAKALNARERLAREPAEDSFVEAREGFYRDPRTRGW